MRMPATPDAARRETSINEEVSVLNLSRAHMFERRDWYHLQLANTETAPRAFRAGGGWWSEQLPTYHPDGQGVSRLVAVQPLAYPLEAVQLSLLQARKFGVMVSQQRRALAT